MSREYLGGGERGGEGAGVYLFIFSFQNLQVAALLNSPVTSAEYLNMLLAFLPKVGI